MFLTFSVRISETSHSRSLRALRIPPSPIFAIPIPSSPVSPISPIPSSPTLPNFLISPISPIPFPVCSSSIDGAAVNTFFDCNFAWLEPIWNVSLINFIFYICLSLSLFKFTLRLVKLKAPICFTYIRPVFLNRSSESVWLFILRGYLDALAFTKTLLTSSPVILFLPQLIL